MTGQPTPSGVWTAESMAALLARQRRSFLAQLPVSADTRLVRIECAIRLLVDNAGKIADALLADYGCRPRDLSRFTEVGASIAALKHARKHLRAWMEPERRPLDFPIGLLGGRAWVEYVPKGVMGIISPWNFPVFLTFLPLAGALAAGNRAMIKPSEHTPATAQLMVELIGGAFDETEVAVCTGGPEVGKAFSELPLGHLLFTGGTAIGRHVMRAAADNLVPVTLELGGKSPVVVGRSADLDRAAMRVALGKLLNAGQTCIAPDYVFVQRSDLAAFVEALRHQARRMYPSGIDDPDYCSIINQRQYGRLLGYVEEARASGVDVVPLFEGGAQDDERHRLGPAAIVAPGPGLAVMRDEIFGPLLPVLAYDDVKQAVDFVNAQPSPLAMYWFDEDARRIDWALKESHAGGMCVNETLMHVTQEELPFGGVGPSGMGHYHGEWGFETFSKLTPVFKQSRFNGMNLFMPPYKRHVQPMLRLMKRL